MTVSLFKIPRAFHLPRVNWDLVRHWIEQNVPVSERAKAWSTLAHEWLEAVDQVLGQTHRTIHSDQIILFAPTDFEHAISLFDLAESGLREMSELLGPLSRRSQTGPLVIMLFADEDSYCRYVSPFDPELESVRSAGVCCKGDYVHVALKPYPLDSLQRTLLHEVAHACLSDRNLPQWIEEGITQMAEEAVVQAWARFNLKPEEAVELRRYWRGHPLNSFWWGNGFHVPDEGQHHCYRLAEILFRQLVADHREKLPEFLGTANYYDAGEEAAQSVLGVGLANIAAQFLGPGPWKPVPPDSAAFVGRGAFFLDRGDVAMALQDLDRAIELAGDSSQAYFHRGLAFYQNGQIAKCISDYERSIELNPMDFHARNNLAWILATCPKDEFRDGERAVQLATAACERTGYSVWYCLGTLAAAHAEKGEFESACNFAEDVLDLAPETDTADCHTRLKSFQSKTPWREDQPLPPYRDS